MCPKVGLCRSRALGLDGLCPLKIPNVDGICRLDRLHDRAGEIAARTIAQAAEHPASLPHTLDEPGLAEQLHVAADARLALAENAGEVLHVELARGEQQEDAQARRIRGGLQPRYRLLDLQLTRTRHPRPPCRGDHINISLCASRTMEVGNYIRT